MADGPKWRLVAASVIFVVVIIGGIGGVFAMMPKPPLLEPVKINEMESRGVDSMRAVLAGHSDVVGILRNTTISLGIRVQRGEIEDWLKWKAAQDAFWNKVGVVAAILAAVFSLGALLKSRTGTIV